MADIEKVIKGVEHCLFGGEICDDPECPYWNDWSLHCCLDKCQIDLKKDLLDVLKNLTGNHNYDDMTNEELFYRRR